MAFPALSIGASKSGVIPRDCGCRRSRSRWLSYSVPLRRYTGEPVAWLQHRTTCRTTNAKRARIFETKGSARVIRAEVLQTKTYARTVRAYVSEVNSGTFARMAAQRRV